MSYDTNMAISQSAGAKWIAFLFCVIYIPGLTYAVPTDDTYPRQLRLSFGESTRDIVIMAATKVNCSVSVKYGAGYFDVDTEVAGRTVVFDQSMLNPDGLHFIHRILLQNLVPGGQYFYVVKCGKSQSDKKGFKVPHNGTKWSPKFLVYGDMGVETESIPALKDEILTGDYTAVLHLGDFAYNLESEGGVKGDQFMDLIEPIASTVPYLTTPGNHEVAQDTFVPYRFRFSTPTTQWPIPLNRMWYSLDIGPVHLVSFSTEVFNMTDKQYIALQRDWLLSDLRAANSNRVDVPWIVAFGHQPFYCSSINGDDCSRENSVVRKNLEDIFFQFSVDLILTAHEHFYERLWPTYRGTVHADNYTDPTAPVTIICGTGGSSHDDVFNTEPGAWSAFRKDNGSMDSYGVLSIANETDLHWEQISALDGAIIDSVWITQSRHGDFATVAPDEAKDVPDWVSGSTTPPGGQEHDTFKEKAKKVVEHVKEIIKSNKPIAIGVASSVSVLLLIGCMCVIVRCRRRKASSRRWERLDYDKSFYSDVKTAEDDFSCDETELQMDGNGTMATSKLLSRTNV